MSLGGRRFGKFCRVLEPALDLSQLVEEWRLVFLAEFLGEIVGGCDYRRRRGQAQTAVVFAKLDIRELRSAPCGTRRPADSSLPNPTGRSRL